MAPEDGKRKPPFSDSVHFFFHYATTPLLNYPKISLILSKICYSKFDFTNFAFQSLLIFGFLLDNFTTLREVNSRILKIFEEIIIKIPILNKILLIFIGKIFILLQNDLVTRIIEGVGTGRREGGGLRRGLGGGRSMDWPRKPAISWWQ